MPDVYLDPEGLNLTLDEVPTRPTRTVAFNASGAAVQSWRADADYDIVGVSGVGQAVLNLVGSSYAILAAAGIHLDWIAIASTSTPVIWLVCRVRVGNGQNLFCSHGAGNSFMQAVLESIAE